MRLGSKEKYLVQILVVLTLLFCWKFELGEILSFLGSIIGVLGAYYIFDKGRKADAADKLNILYQMLDYTVENTECFTYSYVEETVIVIVENGIQQGYTIEEIKEMCSNKFFASIKCNSICNALVETYTDMTDGNKSDFKSLDRFVYYNNWHECIPFIKEEYRRDIIEWIFYLKESKDNNPFIEYDIENFVGNRERIVEILNESSKYKHKTEREFIEEIFDIKIKYAQKTASIDN